MNYEHIFLEHKEQRLSHRYIHNFHIEPLLKKFTDVFLVSTIGFSVLKKPIYGLTIGNGSKRILMWSQMHGNESTTTKALFDMLNYLEKNTDLLNSLTLFIIPILSPDGAEAYTRVNANNIDLNRDAQNLSQPESLVLKTAFEKFKPHFCFNLHGQRTIFSAGATNHSAVVSFLSPAEDKARTVTKTRKIAMEVIVAMNNVLQGFIPNQVGVYDDSFNINCVGDTFQSKKVPTVLFEAGHFPGDYGRGEVRKLIFIALLSGLHGIASNQYTGETYKPYFDIPENQKLFFDIIIRNASVIVNEKTQVLDVAIQYEETLNDNKVVFMPKIVKIDDLKMFYGHKEIDADGNKINLSSGEKISEGDYTNELIIGTKKFSIKAENS